MRLPLSSLDVQNLPLPGDAASAALGLARWHERAREIEDREVATLMSELAADAAGARLLAALFGNSPFLTHCCLKEPGFLLQVVERGSDATFAEVAGALNRDLTTPKGAEILMRRLRRARLKTALLAAVSDIAGWWPLEKVTGALSDFAEAALGAALRHLLSAAAERGDLALAERARPEFRSGLFILGMGKFGARELNYSSDIDLILFFDGETVPYAGRQTAQQLFVQMTRALVRLIDERTEDGYVFRTDLRLRPDPASTPPVMASRAALTYYESTGQNWERAALIKARVVAGDREAGERFLAELKPFLWRKHLDFAAIQDIHSIKRQINAHRGGGRIAILGHNIKLGRGGIREIEFFAQTQQLIWGGRMPQLRIAGTCEALTALAQSGRIALDAADALIDAYRFLRRVEHRLQMIDDQQVHTLPSDQADLEKLAVFLGYPSAGPFEAELLAHLTAVESHYAHLFEEAPSLSLSGNLVFTGSEDDPETLGTLRGLGFAAPEIVAAMVRGWHHGRYRAMRSQRARELMTELVPGLLAAFGRTADPDAALRRFDLFLERLPAGLQLLSLFHANPTLLDMVAEIMSSVPRLADHLAQRPVLLDSVLSAGFFDPMPAQATFAAEFQSYLGAARDQQDVLDLARRWTHDKRFQIGVQVLRGLLDGAGAGAVYADVAESVIAGLLPRIEAEMNSAHGAVPGGAASVLALGKFGGREMTATSDLDLIMVYDAPNSVEASDGPRPLPVSTYYARLWQRMVNALTALTSEGTLYEVDMRLRPSGTKGPLATSLAAFRRYHDGMAWTWEQMALTRARAVTGPPQFVRTVQSEIRAILTRERGPDRLVFDVADMRRRIAEQHPRPPHWDIKHRRGGLIDIEFIAQYLQLRGAQAHPSVLRENTGAALAALAAAGVLDHTAAAQLADALALWRNVQGLLKLAVEEPFDEDAAPQALRQMLARAGGSIDFERLKSDMNAAAKRVRAHFAAIVARPAMAAQRRLGDAAPNNQSMMEDETA